MEGHYRMEGYYRFIPAEAKVFVAKTFKDFMETYCPGYADVLSQDGINTLQKEYKDVRDWADTLANTYDMDDNHSSVVDYSLNIKQNEERLKKAISIFQSDYERARGIVRESTVGEDTSSMHM